MKSNNILMAAFICCVSISSPCIAQSSQGSNQYTDSNSISYFTMPAGSQFSASKWKQLWWGKHWRDEWLQPVAFRIFDLDTTAGGLTPLERGGGHETKTLRLQGSDGREYVLRTIDKNLEVLIPDEFKGTFVADAVNDQISTAHPYGPLVVAHLSAGIGILHTNPVIVYVPDNARLGEFKNDFANKLCLFEERPSGKGWENTPLTRFANDIVNSEKLFSRLDGDHSRKVDQKEFLKVRLFDMLINDWDRHEDQWIWTEEKKEGKTIYKSFARDRDQTFSKTDGVNLFLISRPWALRSVQNMNPTISDVIGSNLSATALDKKFINELTESDWREIIVTLQKLLTDSLIRESLQQMPAPIYSMSGDFLYKRLRQRRDNMLKYGMRYYKIINKEVTLTGSNETEIFTVHKPDKHRIEITIQSPGKKNYTGDTLFHRIFDDNVTNSINIYGLNGNDEFIYTGKIKNRIRIRTFGGDGNDIYTDSLDQHMKLGKATIYDVPDDAPASSNGLNYHATNDTSITNYKQKAFKYDWWMPLLFPGYNPDDGVLIGGAFTYRKQQWHENPFGWQQTIGGNYAFATGAYSLFYKGIFKQVFGKWDLELTANYKAPAYVLNFYGFGNETKLITTDKSFYRVRARSIFFNPQISRTRNKNTLKAGLIFNTVKVESADNKFVNEIIPTVDSSVFKTKYFAGANLSYVFSTANNIKYPTSGIVVDAGSSYLINLKDRQRDFVNLQASFTFYYSPLKNITLAHRTGAATNIGDYEFYQANTLGGSENLRGYWRTRFTGRTSFYQNTDIRWKIADLKGYVFRGPIGIYGFFDDGRVWIKDDHSNTIHTGYGGGLFLIPYGTLAINLYFASSNEVNVFTFRTTFLF